MKQALLFLGLLVAGLAVLFVLLGPEDLIQDYEKPEIEAGAVGALPDSVGLKGSGQQARFGLPARLEGPFTAPRRVRDPDTGEVRQVRTSWLELPTVSRFEGGVFSERPVLDLFREDGTLAARLRGDLGTLYATAAAGSSPATLDAWEAESFHVTGNVVIDFMDDAGETVELQTLTESLLIPGPDPGGGAWDTVECPEPLTIQRPDGSLVLTAARGRVEPDERLAVLSGPVHLEARDLAVLAADGGPDPDGLLVVDGDGELIYRWEERTRGGQDPVARMRGGNVTLTRNVRARQGDRWVQGEHLELRLAPRGRGASGMELRRLVMTSPGPAPVRFGLFSGEGTAESVTLLHQEQVLRLQGPLRLEGVVLERAGRDPLTLDSLTATELAELRLLEPGPDASADPAADEAPGLLQLTLTGDAALQSATLADASGDTLELVLLRTPAADKVETSLVSLTLDGHAHLRVPERSGLAVSGRGDHVSVRPAAEGAQRIQVTGAPARLDLVGDESQRLRGGFLEGPELVVVVPEDPRTPPALALDLVQRAELDVDARSAGALAAAGGGALQHVTVDPSGPCRLDADEDQLALVGAVRLRLPRTGDQEARLECGEFRLEGLTQDQPVVRALQDVFFHDPDQAVTMRCQDLTAGETWVATGADTHVVQAPADGPRLELWGDRVDYTPETGALEASRAGGLARVEGPEALLDAVLPPPEDLDVVRGKVILEAPHFELWPKDPEADQPEPGRLVTRGGTTAHRERDGARLQAVDVDLDLLALEGEVRGTAEAPVLLRLPVEGLVGVVDEVRADWLHLRDEGRRLEIAPAGRFLFHRRSNGRPVELVCDGRAVLEGAELRSDEGVYLSLTGTDALLTARAEHLSVRFDGPLLEGGQPVEVRARQDVTWTHPDLSGTASLLAYDLPAERLDIKAGTEPGVLTSSSGILPFPMHGSFRRLSAKLRLDQPGLPLEGLVLEYGRADRADGERAQDPSTAPQR